MMNKVCLSELEHKINNVSNKTKENDEKQQAALDNVIIF